MCDDFLRIGVKNRGWIEAIMKFEDIKKDQAVIYRGQEYIVVFLNRLKRGNTVSIGRKWPGYNGIFVLEDNADPEEITLAKRSN